MISCIICSRKRDIPAKLKDNIASTIGCEYELVVIDNSSNKHTIFTAYNEGVRRAKGDILCFMHEDILYHTTGWGINVENRYKNDATLGLIGVLGSHYLADCVCSVGDSGLLSSNYYTKDKKNYYCRDKYFDSTGAAEVTTIDGMWYCIRASLFDNLVQYDETYPGFHYYDMDISMQVWMAGYTCKVVNDVLLEHFSYGGINYIFLQNSFKFYNKWKNVLPMLRGEDFTETEIRLSHELSSISAYARELEFYHNKIHNAKWYKFLRKIKHIIR